MLKGMWDFFAKIFGGYERGFKILFLTFALFVFSFGGLNMLMYAGISVLVMCVVAALLGKGEVMDAILFILSFFLLFKAIVWAWG